MTRPKGKLFALLAIFLAIGIVTATGAFTSVSAERTATAAVSGDQSALVGLLPSPTENGNASAPYGASDGYADLVQDELQINLGGYTNGNPDGQGLNYNATTQFNQVFVIQNNGANDVTLHLTRSGNNPETVAFYNGTSYTASENITGSSNSMTLGQGNTVTVSIEVDTVGKGQNQLSSPLIDTFTVHANDPTP